MLKEEIIDIFKYRCLNSKVNNFIFCEMDDFMILDKIPERCSISTPENNIDIDFAQNIKIDLSEVAVKDILSYTLEILKEHKLLDVYLDYPIKFNSKFDLFKFQNILHAYGVVVQLIFYNIEQLDIEEQMLFNEIYYFNSIFFNANAFIKGDNFQSYFLSGERILDNRENYTKVKLFNSKYQKLHDACSQYPEVQLPSYDNRPKFNLEENYDNIACDGFIEKYCLSEEEEKRLKLLRMKKQ